MGEASSQAGLVIAARGVRCEPGGLIAPRGQVLGQGLIRTIKREIPLRVELERPPTGEEATMRGIRPWRRCDRGAIPNTPSGQLLQVGCGIPSVPITAQA